MAIAFDNATDLGNTTGTSLTTSYTVTGSSPWLVVGTLGDTVTDYITSVTYNGVAMTKQDSFHLGGTDRWLQSWYLANPATGAHNVVVTASSSSFISAVASSWTGVPGTTPDAVLTSSGSAPAGDLVNTLTTSADNSWHIAVGGLASGTPIAGTSTTRRILAGVGNLAIFDGNVAVTPAGSNTINIQRSGGSDQGYAMIGSSISPTLSYRIPPNKRLTQAVNRASTY